MSDTQTAWTILWRRALGGSNPGAPFEIDEAAPAVAAALKVTAEEARALIGNLLSELDRLPEGERYFTREGNAVVPLPEFLSASAAHTDPVDAYPYEL
jgi:hypothetical protein